MAIVAHFLADFVDFFTNTERADAALKQLNETTKNVDGTTKTLGQTSASVFGSMAGYIAGAFSVGAVVAFGKAMIDDAEALTKMSAQTGISTENLQRLQGVADASGNSIESLTGAINTMQNRIAEGNKDALAALDRLGISLADLKSKSPDEQFKMIARAVGEIEDPMNKVNTAMALFGKTGAEILPSLRSDIDEIADSTRVMADASTKKLEALGQKWQQLTRDVKLFAAAQLALDQDAQLDAYMRNVEKMKAIAAGALPDLAGVYAALPELPKGDPFAVPGLPPPDVIAASDRAMRDLGDTIRDNLTAQKAAKEEADRWAAAWANVNLVFNGYQSVLDTINGETVEAVRNALDLGAAEADLSRVYQLRPEEMKAITMARDADVAAAKKQQDAEKAYGQMILDTSAEIQKAHDAARAAREAAINTETDGVKRLENAYIEAQAAWDRAFADSHSSAETLNAAWSAVTETYEAWNQAATEAIAEQGTAMQQTKTALEDVGSTARSVGAAIVDVGHGVKLVLQETMNFASGLHQVTDMVAADFAALPTARSLELASRVPGSMLGQGTGQMIQSMLPTAGVGWSINALGLPETNAVYMQNGAITMNYPMVNDPQALDELARIVGQAMGQKASRAGVR